MSTELALPTSVRPETWDADTAAMMEFAGLTWTEKRGEETVRLFAPSGITAAFIQACRRTGLDPTAKQIYAALIGGKWTILTGVDGFRVVAQRSGQYTGQTPIQWTADGVTWVDAWLPELQGGKKGDKPAAARIGILRKGFTEPLMQVVTWAEFGKSSGNWNDRPAHMLAIRAETHALRRAFPNDLSGLYTPEDFDTEAVDTGDAIVVLPSEDWKALLDAATTKDEITAVVERIKSVDEGREFTDELRTYALARYGTLSRTEAAAVPEAPAEPEPPAVVAEPLDEAHPDYVAPEVTA
jgi:phage recombination protein Bet